MPAFLKDEPGNRWFESRYIGPALGKGDALLHASVRPGFTATITPESLPVVYRAAPHSSPSDLQPRRGAELVLMVTWASYSLSPLDRFELLKSAFVAQSLPTCWSEVLCMKNNNHSKKKSLKEFNECWAIYRHVFCCFDGAAVRTLCTTRCQCNSYQSKETSASLQPCTNLFPPQHKKKGQRSVPSPKSALRVSDLTF